MKMYEKTYKPALFLLGLSGIYFGDSSLYGEEGANLWAATTSSTGPSACALSPCSKPCPIAPGQVTPEASACVQCPINVGVYADFIYWSVREDKLQFIETVGTGSFSSEVDVRTTTEKLRASIGGIDSALLPPSSGFIYPNWKMSPGLRAGIDFMLGYDGWDLYAQYTWLNQPNSKKQVPISVIPGSTQLFGTQIVNGFALFHPSEGINYILISNQWSFCFNVIDVGLGRDFFVSPKLTLRPHFGLKGTWQKQRLSTKSTYVGFFDDSDNFPGTCYGKDTLKYSGVGLRAGLDTSWFIHRTFSLFAKGSATAMYEYFKDTYIQYLSVPDLASTAPHLAFVPLSNFYNQVHVLCPVLEGEIGLRFETWFGKGGYHAAFEAGWELQWWHAQNKMIGNSPSFSPISPNEVILNRDLFGDLMLQGLTLGVRLDF